MLCAVLALTVGTSVAYYNTKSFGFDEDVKIITKDNEKLSFLDYEIYYKDLYSIYNNIQKIVPENSQVVSI